VIALRPEPAILLAALRIVVPALLLLAPGFRQGVHVAAWDPARWVAPEGLGWFVNLVPIQPGLARAAQVVMAFSALCALVGVFARPALVSLTLSGFYLYSIAQLTGFVWHDMHLLWFSALLAASPCDDVLAFDARRALDVEGVSYAVPLECFRLLLSAIYFFPGLHKILESGIAWALSDNLQNQLYYKWAQHGIVPSFRIDHHPWLLKSAGVFVLAFELAFPILVHVRRTRPLAAGLGIAFHLLSAAIFRIPFASLWICYVALFDLRRPVRWIAEAITRARKRPSVAPTDPEHRPAEALDGAGRLALSLVIGALLVAGAVVQGARGQMSSYPFACYPTFQWRAANVMPDLGLYRVDHDQYEHEIVHARDGSGYRSQRSWAELWSLAGVWGPATPDRLRAYVRAALRDPGVQRQVPQGSRLRVYRLDRSVLPAEREHPPARRKLLLEIETARGL
jgi:hypothetical protein